MSYSSFPKSFFKFLYIFEKVNIIMKFKQHYTSTVSPRCPPSKSWPDAPLTLVFVNRTWSTRDYGGDMSRDVVSTTRDDIKNNNQPTKRLAIMKLRNQNNQQINNRMVLNSENYVFIYVEI